MMKVSESENYVDSIDSAVCGEIHTYMYVDDNRNNIVSSPMFHFCTGQNVAKFKLAHTMRRCECTQWSPCCGTAVAQC